jgi:hypothetical protein
VWRRLTMRPVSRPNAEAGNPSEPSGRSPDNGGRACRARSRGWPSRGAARAAATSLGGLLGCDPSSPAAIASSMTPSACLACSATAATAFRGRHRCRRRTARMLRPVEASRVGQLWAKEEADQSVTDRTRRYRLTRSRALVVVRPGVRTTLSRWRHGFKSRWDYGQKAGSEAV